MRQFHFKAWPDKDVPDNAWCMVDFWRAVDTHPSSNPNPIVIHCRLEQTCLLANTLHDYVVYAIPQFKFGTQSIHRSCNKNNCQLFL